MKFFDWLFATAALFLGVYFTSAFVASNEKFLGVLGAMFLGLAMFYAMTDHSR